MSKATYKRKNVYRGLEFIMVEQRHSNTGIDRDKQLRAHILSHKQKVEYIGNDESFETSKPKTLLQQDYTYLS